MVNHPGVKQSSRPGSFDSTADMFSIRLESPEGRELSLTAAGAKSKAYE
jgi:hypothetical protein